MYGHVNAPCGPTFSLVRQGDSGSWYSSAPGNGIDVISVASVEKYVPIS